jgi:hypothetical protein
MKKTYKQRLKKMTYKETKDFIESIFDATAAGYEHDAFLKASLKINELAERGYITDTILNRGRNYCGDMLILRLY